MTILVVSGFFCNEIGILSIDVNNFTLDDTNYDEDDPKVKS